MIYPPEGFDYHAVNTPTCSHLGKHKRNKAGRLLFDKTTPVVEPITSLSCTPECERWVVRRLGWTTSPPAAVSQGLDVPGDEESLDKVQGPDRVIVNAAKDTPVIVPLRR